MRVFDRDHPIDRFFASGIEPKPIDQPVAAAYAQLEEEIGRCGAANVEGASVAAPHVSAIDAYYLASATLLPKTAIVQAVNEKRSSTDIAQKFGTSPELVDYRIKRLGLWRDHVGKKVLLASD